VTKLASESTLSRIINLVAEAQEDATPTQQFIDRFSQPYTYTVIGATLLAIVLPRSSSMNRSARRSTAP
jgi:Cd2+/Zn2+-exporting ATPase